MISSLFEWIYNVYKQHLIITIMCRVQVPVLSSPEVTYEPGSEVIQAEWDELRRRAASLEEELTQLQALVSRGGVLAID